MTASNISLPTWVPEFVQELFQEAERADLPPEQRLILERLATDTRMQHVWSYLLRRDRGSGEFVHPALSRDGQRLPSEDKRQLSALGELFHFLFCAARDKMMVTKAEQVLQNKEYLLDNANRLRNLANDLVLARSRGMFGVSDPLSQMIADRDVQALVHVANWLEGLTTAARSPDDPMIVAKHRGDPVARGVQILAAVKLEELFGSRLDGTASTLASVALGVKTSARASRSALSTPKPSKKAGSKRR
jgi:hypothetical protein